MRRSWKIAVVLLSLASQLAAQGQSSSSQAPVAPATSVQTASEPKVPSQAQINPSQASEAPNPQAQPPPAGQPPSQGAKGPSGSPNATTGGDPATGYFGYTIEKKGDPNSTVYETANTNNYTDTGLKVKLDKEPDVHLNATLHVGEIMLEVLNISAKVNLDAEVKGLLKFNAGVTVNVDRVRLLIQGIEARVLLEARLGNLVKIISDVLDSLDLNPIIASLANGVGQVVNHTISELGKPLQGNLPGGGKPLAPRSLDIDHNVLYSVNDYSGNTHTNRILEQNGEIVEEHLNNHGQRTGNDVVGYYSRDMVFNGHDKPRTFKGEAVREREYVYEPFPGLSVVSAVYINDAGKVVGAQVISERFGGGSSTVETVHRKR